MRLGIYVGSFNPVHKGHIKVANYLVDNNYLDMILLLPTPNYWDKQDLAPTKDRLNMLKIFETSKIKIDSIHNNYPYTYQVLRSLKKEYPKDELYLIIGSDNLKKLHLWKNIDEILSYKIMIVKRDKDAITKYLENFPNNRFIVIDNFIPIEVSSTIIRNNLSDNNLDQRVLTYIKNYHLYEREIK